MQRENSGHKPAASELADILFGVYVLRVVTFHTEV